MSVFLSGSAKMFVIGVKGQLFTYQENILVLDGDQFTEDPVSVLQSVERFLHIPSFYTDNHFTYNGDSSHWENHHGINGNFQFTDQAATTERLAAITDVVQGESKTLVSGAA